MLEESPLSSTGLSSHHEKVLEAYESHTKKWKERTKVPIRGKGAEEAGFRGDEDTRDHYRCRVCWLRSYDCYCQHRRSYLESRRAMYRTCYPDNLIVTIYYHFHELGRSPNTMHLMPLLTPEICNSLVFGDVEAESKLLRDIIEENENGIHCTCILYPTPSSQLLPDFVEAARKAKSKEKSATGKSTEKPINLVILDGTYSHARRQLRHLQAMLDVYNASLDSGKSKVQLPVVKLLLGDEGCASAIIGIMKQPSVDKICSLQATVLGMKQAGVPSKICDMFDEDLSAWLAYLLQRGIKECKSEMTIGGKRLNEATHKPLEVVSSYYKQRIDAELCDSSTPLYRNASCCIGSLRSRILPRPHFISRLHRTAQFQINLVETQKFSVCHAVLTSHMRGGRRKCPVDADADIAAAGSGKDHHRVASWRRRLQGEDSGSSGGEVQAESTPCVEVVLHPRHGSSRDAISFRGCVCSSYDHS